MRDANCAALTRSTNASQCAIVSCGASSDASTRRRLSGDVVSIVFGYELFFREMDVASSAASVLNDASFQASFIEVVNAELTARGYSGSLVDESYGISVSSSAS